eukprot:TCONS_00060720-protein
MGRELELDVIIKQLLDVQKTQRQAAITETNIRLLCMKAREVFLEESNLTEVQFLDLLRHFEQVGFPGSNDNKYIFLGDYVDRGQYSLETICLLLCYKLKYPKQMFLLRGNHECASINRIYGFYDECKRRYNIKLWKTFTDCFNCLPMAGVVENTIFCVHGGLSPDFQHLDQIRNFERPSDIPDFGLMNDLLWSDPDEDITGWGENDRGVSWTFGGDIVNSFLKKNNFSLVARAHQVIEDGYQFFQKRKLVTLFSAPNYCGEFDNAGATMFVSDELVCSFSILKPKSMAELEAQLENKNKKKK